MNFVDVIKGCESANGAGSKKVIQSVLAKADVNARRLISEALNPYRVFNVKKFDMPSSSTKTMDEQQDFQQFFDLLDKLHDRELTGNAARDAITASLSEFNIHTQQYLARVLDTDLKAGFSAETFNKVWPKEPIPVFDVMLADKCESVEDFEKNINFPCQGDYKYDGCLSRSWTIELKDGRIVTIGDFVDSNMEGEVLSYNNTSRVQEWKKITAKIKNSMPERTYEWFKLTLEDGTELPPLTGNHRIWLHELKCWRRVDELQVDDIILSKVPSFSPFEI